MRPFPTVLTCGAVVVARVFPMAWGEVNKGEEYFQKSDQGNCRSCHYPDKRRLVGLGLRGVTQRHSVEWLELFLNDPQETWDSDHPETLELKKRVRKTRAPVTVCRKENMTSENYRNLMDYLESLEKQATLIDRTMYRRCQPDAETSRACGDQDRDSTTPSRSFLRKDDAAYRI